MIAMTSFGKLLREATRTSDGFRLDVPASWHQGRTAYGGLSAAIALEAARQVGGEGLPPLRSAQVAFVGPVNGPIEARARLLRRGRNATWIGAELSREGEVVLTATFVFNGQIESGLVIEGTPAPAGLIPVEEAVPFPPGAASPAFLRTHCEVRYAVPRGTEKHPEICWWVRLRDREGLNPLTEVVLIGDALPPGVMPLLDRRVPISSMNWHINVLDAAPTTRDGWWLLRDHGDQARHGASSDTLHLWTADGRPVLAGLQSVAIFG